MKSKLIDGFLLVGSSLSPGGEQNYGGMNRPLLQDVFTTEVNVSLIILNLQFLNLNTMVSFVNIFNFCMYFTCCMFKHIVASAY